MLQKVDECSSLSEAQAATQPGTGATGATSGVDGIASSRSPASQSLRSGLLHVGDGEQLSPGLSLEECSGFSVSHL